MKTLTGTACLLLLITVPAVAAGAEPDAAPVYPHRVGAVFGGSIKSDGKVAVTYGLEYALRLNDLLGVGLFYQQSEGDYGAETVGIPVSVYLADDLKVLLGAGLERDLFSDDELLLRAGVGQDLRWGRFALTPSAWIDFVNGKQILTAGLVAGIAF